MGSAGGLCSEEKGRFSSTARPYPCHLGHRLRRRIRGCNRRCTRFCLGGQPAETVGCIAWGGGGSTDGTHHPFAGPTRSASGSVRCCRRRCCPQTFSHCACVCACVLHIGTVYSSSNSTKAGPSYKNFFLA
jgi:hypothetical protein